jgi:DNA-binding transcriptional regulator YdaS (Cro superfamily)
MRWEGGKIPAERVPPVCKFTGICPHELRPDLYPVPAPASA